MVEVTDIVPKDALIEAIRNVSLLSNPDVKPYESASGTYSLLIFRHYVRQHCMCFVRT